MSTNVTWNGSTYTIPSLGDSGWGQYLSQYLIAIPQGALQKSGGSFTLTADVNFGATFGLFAAYLKSRSSNISTTGLVRLARTDVMSWRNQANSANLDLGVNASNQLTFGGNALYPLGITALTGDVTATGPGSVAATIAAIQGKTVSGTTGTVNVVYSASPTLTGTLTAAAIAATSLSLSGLTASRALVTDGSSNVAVSAVTGTQLGYLSGASGTTGTGNLVYSSSPTFVTPALGTPASGTLTNTTGFPAANLAGLGAGIAAFLATPSSANLATAVTDETGTAGSLVFSVSPTLTGTLSAAAGTFTGNLLANSVSPNFATTVTAAGTTTLTVSSAQQQYFTGSSNQTVRLPNATTLPRTGFSFRIVNLGSGIVNVQNAGGVSIQAIAAISSALVTVSDISSSNGVWDAAYITTAAGSGTVTSVSLSVPATSILSVTGSPITSTGTLGLLTTGTSGGIPYFSDANTLSTSAALTASQLIVGGGAGAAPVTLAAGSQYQVLVMGAANPGYGQVNLAQSAAVTGILPNANTTAASANTASAIVTRDGSGNFAAGVITSTGNTISGLTASSAVATDGSKNLVSVTNTGTGNNVLSAGPSLTGTVSLTGTPVLGVGTTTALVGSVEQLINSFSTTAGGTANGALANRLTLTGNTAVSAGQRGMYSDYLRAITTSTTDTSNQTSFVARLLFDVATGQTLTCSSALGFTALGIVGTSIASGGAVTGNVFGLQHFGDTTPVSGYKAAIKLSAISGGTNNALITDNVAFSGSFAINLASTNASSLAGALSVAGNLTLPSLTVSTALALDASRNIVSVTNTGTGSNVLATSPTLVTPLLGTPTSGTLTNCTGLPIATGISGLGTGIATFLATPSSANLATAVTDETGTGSLVFGTSPVFTTKATIQGSSGDPALFIRKDDAATTDLYWGIIDTGISPGNALIFGHGPNQNTTGFSTIMSMLYTGAINLPNLTASTALALDSSKNIVSVTNTGTGNNVLSASPTLSGTLTAAAIVATSLTSPLNIGGTGTGSSLTLQSTSGVGATDFIKFNVGNNGAVEAMRILTAGSVVVGGTAAIRSAILTANGSITARNGGVDATYADAIIASYTGNTNEHNVIQSSVSTTATSSGFRFKASDGAGSSTTTNVLDLTRGQTIFYTGGTQRASIDSSGNFNVVNLTASRAVVTDASKNLASSATTATQVGYLSGATGTTGTGALVLNSAPTIVGQVLIQSPGGDPGVFIRKDDASVTDLYWGIVDTSQSTSNSLIIGHGPSNNITGFSTFLSINYSGAITMSNLAGSGSRAVNADASGTLSAASDSRLKTEIPSASIPGLDEVMQLQPRAYQWNKEIERIGEENAAVEIGFFADDVAPIIPSAAPMGNDGYYGFYDRSVVAALVKAVQELKAEIDLLKNN